MEHSEIRSLVGSTIFARGEKYWHSGAVQEYACELSDEAVRHISARVKGHGIGYRTEAWLREDGEFLNGSCSCPYNANGEGALCKHIAALLLYDRDAQAPPPPPAPAAKVVKGSELPPRSAANTGSNAGSAAQGAPARPRSSYAANLEMLFGAKWRGGAQSSAPAKAARPAGSEWLAQQLLQNYAEADLAAAGALAAGAPKGTVHLALELNMGAGQRSEPCVRLRIDDGQGGRAYIVRSPAGLLQAVDQRLHVSYGKQLAFVHAPDAFDPASAQLLELLRRQVALNSYYAAGRMAAPPGEDGRGGMPLAGSVFDQLYQMYQPQGEMGGYRLHEGTPPLTLTVQEQPGGMLLGLAPRMEAYVSADAAYLYTGQDIWRMVRAAYLRLEPALRGLMGHSLFFAAEDAAAFGSYVLPELGAQLQLQDPAGALLRRLPQAPVVQFYLDARPGGQVTAYAAFVYGEDKVSPFDAAPAGLLRDVRAERRAQQLLQVYLHHTGQGMCESDTDEEIYRFLEQGVPALMEAGEVYFTDAFRNMQAPPPRVAVRVSVNSGLLDLDVDTGEFPAGELQALLDALHSKKRYHRLRNGRILRLDEGLQALEELNETLQLAGASLQDAHTQLPLYRAPSLDKALSGQNEVRFDRDDAFRQISRSFHTVRDSAWKLPPQLQGVLRQYQREGYRWLRTLDGYGMGGILADDMGLGKTLQVLAYLLALKLERQQQGQPAMPSLVVCPASLVLNWEEECRKFTPQLCCLTVDGDAASRAGLVAGFAGQDLVVTSYDLLRRDIGLYGGQQFYACILDEAQAIKNHTTQKYKAVCRVRSRVRFALTGTPVENRLSELWSIFSFLMPGYLYPHKQFVERFEKPIMQQNDAGATRRLNRQVEPFILRRMKKQVLRELPPKIEKVARVQLPPDQRKLYLAAVLQAKQLLQAAGGGQQEQQAKMAVLAQLTRLRQICCDPRLVAEGWQGASGKLAACCELIAPAVEGGHRVLVFSQFTSMLELLRQQLQAMGISCFTLQGSTPKPERAALVRRFNGGEASVFLISLRAGGTGLNLTAADIVVHYDPWWNLAAQNQATDRAYRIGQQNTVQVYRLIAQDTIEEKILQMQQAKQTVADSVTGSADGAILAMSKQQLLQLLGG